MKIYLETVIKKFCYFAKILEDANFSIRRLQIFKFNETSKMFYEGHLERVIKLIAYLLEVNFFNVMAA